MALTLKNRGYNPGPDLFYQEKFLRLVEDHLPVLRASQKLNTAELPPMLANRFEHDFIGLLNYLQVPNERHPIVIRVNGLKSSEDFSSTTKQLLLPSDDDIEQLRQAYLTSYA